MFVKSARYKLFQVNYPKLVASKVTISMSEFASTDLKIFLDGLSFLNSYWKFHGVNVEIINCNAASLVLELNHLKHAIIHNCTFGNWTFSKVQNAFIKNCNNVFDEDVSTSLKFYNSSAFIQHTTIEHGNMTEDFSGILVYDNSLLRVEQSKFVNNTVRQGVIKILKSSWLIMSNCTVYGNYATYFPGVIYTKESFVHLKNTYFNGNRAIYGGGVIMIRNMSFLKMKNCTFKTNSVHRTKGVGGAILSLNNSLLDISCSIFNHNRARLGGAIHQETSNTMKLDQCTFSGNSKTAIVGLSNSQISITNSIFQNNIAKGEGGAAVLAQNSVLTVLNTTFHNNSQVSASNSNPFQILNTNLDRLLGGGAISLINSVGHILKSTFENNVATWAGGAIFSTNGSMYIKNSKFQRNKVLDKIIGLGGGLFLDKNSTMKISNVLLSACHAINGAAIGTNSSTFIMSNSYVTSNTGSAIFLLNGCNGESSEINNSTFFNNSTPQEGGAIMCLACAVKMLNTRFSHNMAVTGGGAIKLYSGSKSSAKNCSFTYNTGYDGGAISVTIAELNISDSNLSHNNGTNGGAMDLIYGYLLMTNCRMNNNTAPENGGVINAAHGTVLMSNCIVFNNFANGEGGVVKSTDTKLFVVASIFEKNTALGSGGVFYMLRGAALLRNSSLVKNIAKITGCVLAASDHVVINITQSFVFGNQAGYAGAGVLYTKKHTTTLISNTKIIQNSAEQFGALWITENSILELNGSLVEGNHAELFVGALYISNSSLLVAFNSTFKGNRSYKDSSIHIENSTVFLEKCTFVENQLTHGGTISTDQTTKLKISNTAFTQNDGYNLFYYAYPEYLINKIETHRCWFINGNISFSSNAKNFEDAAVKEKVIGQISTLNQRFFKLRETPYASSKMFHIMNLSYY